MQGNLFFLFIDLLCSSTAWQKNTDRHAVRIGRLTQFCYLISIKFVLFFFSSFIYKQERLRRCLLRKDESRHLLCILKRGSWDCLEPSCQVYWKKWGSVQNFCFNQNYWWIKILIFGWMMNVQMEIMYYCLCLQQVKWMDILLLIES